ncbi:MAG: phosphate/phosphite/phosphonate ABC transporter substrate-binding protein [Ignavibacteria bacterium]|nr:phosphate/phosphite/phosphonate ABC transporter substrate-binding protein [Ignavibacteria bacterium]
MSSLKNILILFYLISSFYLTPLYCQSPDAENVEMLNMIFSKKIFPKVDFHDAVASIEIWTKELIPEVTKKYSLNNIFIEGLDHVDKKYLDQNVSFIVLSVFEYLYDKEKLENLSPILVSSDEAGIIGIEYVILVNKESNINSLKDLKNKTITFIDDYANAIPRLWLDVLLKSEGLSLSNKFFKQIQTSANANQAILKTYFKQVDACVVPKKLLKTSIELNPQLESNLFFLKQSLPLAAGVFCVNKNINESTRKEFIKTAKIAANTERGKQIALFFRSNELIDYKAEYFDNIKSLIEQAQKFKINIIE